MRREATAILETMISMNMSLSRVICVRGFFEVLFVSFLFILSSWYWAVDEHVVFIGLFAGAALLGIDRWTGFRQASISSLVSAGLFGVFLGWLLLSTLWSGVFHFSFSYALLALLVGITGAFVAYAFAITRLLLGLALGTLFIVVHAALVDGNGLFGIFTDPSLQKESHALEGLFTNVSSITFLFGIGIVATLSASFQSRFSKLAAFLLAVFFIALLIDHDVLTGLFAVIGAGAVSAMVAHVRSSNFRGRSFLRWGYSILVLLAATLFWFLREPILRPIGEAPDLAGRVILWEWYFEAFLWRPIVGAGWGNTVGWPPLQRGRLAPVKDFFPAHNGFIDVGLMLGGVGALLMIATLVALFLSGARLATNTRYSTAYVFIPALVTYLTLNDLMATSLPRFIGLFLVGAMVGMVLKKPEPSALGHDVKLDSPNGTGRWSSESSAVKV